jgi:hypothetical protein
MRTAFKRGKERERKVTQRKRCKRKNNINPETDGETKKETHREAETER